MPDSGSLRIDIVEEAGDWNGFDAARVCGSVCREVTAGLPRIQGVAVLVLADDATVRDLNRRFRGKDKPTNVLSFPSGAAAAPGAYLGDIVLAIETLAREADEQGTRRSHHFAHLAVHGLLHLLGYDHDSDADAERMEREEARILAGLGIADPYGEPALSGAAAN
jgi:probable rRNA maturation factor